MNLIINQTIDKIKNAIDSDDVQAIASYIETNVPNKETDVLQLMLKQLLEKKDLNMWETKSVKQFLEFIG